MELNNPVHGQKFVLAGTSVKSYHHLQAELESPLAYQSCGIFNVGSPETVTVEEWVRLCYAVLGKEPELRYVSADVPQRSYFPFYDYEYLLDVTAMCSIMPDVTPLEQVLCGSYEWFRSNRELIVRKPLLGFIADNLENAEGTKWSRDRS